MPKNTGATDYVIHGQRVEPSTLRVALASRHADSLDGRLLELYAIEAPRVTIVVSAASAQTNAGQHLAVHLANLIGRLEGVVSTLAVRVESDVTLRPGIDPRAPCGSGTFEEAARRAGTLAATYRMRPVGPIQYPELTIRVGSGEPDQADVFVSAGNWTAYVGRRPGPECVTESASAVGAHVAAAFGAAEVFRMIRAAGRRASGPDGLCFSAWNWRAVDTLEAGDRAAVAEGANGGAVVLPAFTLAGVGAVGSALLLTLWASGVTVPRAEIVDGDAISTTNLNRYLLFALTDVGMPKVDGAANLLARQGDRPFRLLPVREWWSDHQRRHGCAAIQLLVSAVDTNVIRHQLQDALPGIIIGASTHGLRVEVGRYDLSDETSRCLKCFNVPEIDEQDALLQRRLLSLSEADLAQEAEDCGVELVTLRSYVDDVRRGGTGCAILAGANLNRLRHRGDERAFSVSFVSSLAGTLLAGQIIREAIGIPLLLSPETRAILQLWKPEADTNAVYSAPRDPGCWCASPLVRVAHRARWPRIERTGRK